MVDSSKIRITNKGCFERPNHSLQPTPRSGSFAIDGS